MDSKPIVIPSYTLPSRDILMSSYIAYKSSVSRYKQIVLFGVIL